MKSFSYISILLRKQKLSCVPVFNYSYRLFINKISQNTAIFCHQAMQMVGILEIPDQCAKCSKQTFKCKHKLLLLFCYYKKWTLFYHFSQISTINSTHQAAYKRANQNTYHKKLHNSATHQRIKQCEELPFYIKSHNLLDNIMWSSMHNFSTLSIWSSVTQFCYLAASYLDTTI